MFFFLNDICFLPGVLLDKFPLLFRIGIPACHLFPFSLFRFILDYLTPFKIPFYLLLALFLSILLSGGSKIIAYILTFFHPLRIHTAHITWSVKIWQPQRCTCLSPTTTAPHTSTHIRNPTEQYHFCLKQSCLFNKDKRIFHILPRYLSFLISSRLLKIHRHFPPA